jgi:tetratricopeptide (TPR) repeat protein
LEREHDNLRAALRWARESGETPYGVRLAGTLWRFWYVHGHLSEGREWLESFLTLKAGDEGSIPVAVRAKALTGAGVLANIQGDYERASTLCEDSLALYRSLDDKQGMAIALNILGSVAENRGDYERAVMLSEESLALYRGLNNKRGVAVALNNLGSLVQKHLSDFERAGLLYEESLTLFRDLGDKRGIALLLTNLGEVARRQTDHERAMALYEEGVALARAIGDSWTVAVALSYLGDVARDQGNYEWAGALYTESLESYQAMGDKAGIAECLEEMASVACAQGQSERTARLCGAAATLRIAIGAPLPPTNRDAYDHILAQARAELGNEAFAAAFAAGAALSLEQAIAEAGAQVL